MIRRLLLATLLSLWTFCAHAAGWLPLVYPCPTAQASIARLSGSITATEKAAYQAMICAMVGDGTWALLDGLYIFATDSTADAAVNLVQSSYGASVVGVLTFSAGVGWAGNGTNSALNTNFTPSTASSPHFALNSASFGVYDRTSRTTGSGPVAMGTANGASTSYTLVEPYTTAGGGGTAYELNGFTFPQYATTTNAQGEWLVSRITSSLVTLYGNGNSLASSSADSSVALSDKPMYIFALNNGGTIGSYTSDQLSAAWWGASMTSTQACNFSHDLNSYMIALGINVYSGAC